MSIRLHIPPHFIAAKTWIARILLEDLLGLSVEISVDTSITNYILGLPNGKKVVLEDHFFRHCVEGSFLDTAVLPEKPLNLIAPLGNKAEIIALYGNNTFITAENGIHCGLDLLASAFFMLSRWEEYGKEQDGRFPANEAFAVRHGFLHRPIVNEYAELLHDCLETLGLKIPYPRQEARLHLSCDVDHPNLWYHPADRLRTLAGSILRRFNPAELGYWLTGPFWRKQDPFDVFDHWMDIAEKKGLYWHFNFLGGRAAAPDCEYDLEAPFVRRLLQHLHERGHVIGFHPSRAAVTDPTNFSVELKALQSVAPGPVRSGRQHYLHFKAPDTWNLWAEAGMDWDSSMGYAGQEGFRCGIAQAFQVFDFERQQVLPLWEKPLIAMDVTLAKYRRLTPRQAYDNLQQLGAETKKHGGEMVLLWHNSSWNTYFWAPWQEVLRQFIHNW